MWTKLTCMNCEIICLIHPRSSSKKKSKRRSEQREVEEMRYYNEHESEDDANPTDAKVDETVDEVFGTQFLD